MNEHLDIQARDTEHCTRRTFWQWVAVCVLLLCWIAEAAVCAERGL